MGHRHVFSPSYMFETEDDQRWNLTEHPYPHIAQSSAAESNSITYPTDNTSIDGPQYASHCNPTPVSTTYSSLPHEVQNSQYQQNVAGPSNLPTDPPPDAGFYASPENYTNTASSSNNNGHNIHENDSFDIRVNNGRLQYKRKSPCISNRYNSGAGSSSDMSMPIEPWEETPDIDFLHTSWAGHGGHGLSLGAESSVRNVRSRATLDLETNPARTPFPNNLANDYYAPSCPLDIITSSGHLMGQRSHGPAREWNPAHSSSVHDNELNLNPFLVGSSNPNASLEMGRHNNGPVTRNDHFQGTSLQSARGTRSNFIQRPGPTFRASSSSFRLGHVDAVALDEGADRYSSRHPRPLPTVTWRSGDWNGRASFRDRSMPERLMIVDRSTFYGSRNPFDHHRDMRLDIDDMSYEELLALGERIGSVNTGLSEDLIRKCLTESIYCSSDQIQEEGTCVICLEEYANMDDVGMLKGCRHDFHVGCIKKWLSMKNLCPICKSEPVKHK